MYAKLGSGLVVAGFKAVLTKEKIMEKGAEFEDRGDYVKATMQDGSIWYSFGMDQKYGRVK